MSRARPNMQMPGFFLPFRTSAFTGVVIAATLGIHPQPLLAQNGPPPNAPYGQQNDPRFRNLNNQGQPPVQPPAPTPAPVSTLPATQPTTLPAPATVHTPAPPPTTPAKRAEVTYEDGLLHVRADDSSLNQILHSISRRTGMTITGGVADQRIFGSYGPAAPSIVLATLLDGTGVNMLLREGSNSVPVELVLTQRGGGPTPPSPNEGHYDDAEDNSPARGANQIAPSQQPPTETHTANTTPTPTSTPAPAPPIASQPLSNPLGNPNNASPTASTLNTTNSVPTDTLPSPSTSTQPAQGIVDAPNPPPPGSTSDANGTSNATPEAIYQQLLKLQQQQSKGATNTAPGSNSNSTTTPPQ